MKNTPNTKRFPFEIIQNWYQKNGRQTLPWRQVYHLPDRERVYRVWIAEVMLQQTQVDRVITYYNRFIEKYPTIEALAKTTYEELFPYYQGLGYYGRARRMIQLAQVLIKEHAGIFPDDLKKLQKLPGIGAYTAQAILAFGYDAPILAIDANLQKIFSRYYFGARYTDKKTCDNTLEELQKQVENSTLSGREINNALMDFGALISTTFDKIDKATYPLIGCKWFETKGIYEQKNRKIQKQKNPKKYSCLVFLHQEHKHYWSSHQNHYEPFLIESTHHDDRTSIQDYFAVTYKLEVSVRPSFGHARYGDLDVKLFYAQIQTGDITFTSYPKDEEKKWKGIYLTTSAK